MNKRIVVIGGVAGGASAAARIRRLDADAEITILERGEHVSFSNCALPYHLSGTVANSDSLVLMTPEKFKKQHEIQVRVRSEATAINRQEKTVTVHDLEKDTFYDLPYDKLVLSPGANPILPGSIAGIQSPHVFSVRNVTDIKALKAYMDDHKIQKAAVIGGGFIGIEVAENMAEA